MVGFEWGKQDLSVDGNGAGQQNHVNGNGQQPQQQQQPPQVVCFNCCSDLLFDAPACSCDTLQSSVVLQNIVSFVSLVA